MSNRRSFVPLNQVIPEHKEGRIPDFLHRDYPLPAWMFEDSPYDELAVLSSGSAMDQIPVAVRLTSVGTTRGGKPFVRVMIQDRSDSLPGVLWASNDTAVLDFTDAIQQRGVLAITGYISEYPKDSGQRQCVIQDFKRSDVSAHAVLPTAWPMYNPYTELYEMLQVLQRIRPPLRDMALHSIQKYWPDFGLAPAALSYHHAFLGGLLVHTSQVLRLLSFVTREASTIGQEIQAVTLRFLKSVTTQTFEFGLGSPYLSSSLDHAFQLAESCNQVLAKNVIDIGLCLLAGLYHDLGKVKEYQFSHTIDMHPEGKLIGHIFESARIASDAAETVSLPEPLQCQLLHAILSHHGLYEYGSPVKPQTPEALVLHWADYICSRCS